MTSDINERLLRIEEDRDTQCQRRNAAAAKTAGLHDPGLAVKLIDRSSITTSGDADRAVADFAAAHPYMRPQMISEEEQRRIWGTQILDQIERS
jgi:hypothetical protein